MKKNEKKQENDRKKHMRDEAICVFELTKGFTGAQLIMQ